MTADHYGDGNCYRGVASKESEVPTLRLGYDEAMDVITALKQRNRELETELHKYKAFWEWSRLADKQAFELYDYVGKEEADE